MYPTLQRTINRRAICPVEAERPAPGWRWRSSALLKRRVATSKGFLALEDVCVGPLAGLIIAALNSEAPADMYIECPALDDGFGLIEMKRLVAEPDFPLGSRL